MSDEVLDASEEETYREPMNPEDAEKNIRTILRMTQADHWFDYGDEASPSMKRSGCDLVAAAFGICSDGPVTRDHEDYQDGTIRIRIYHANGRFSSNGSVRVIDAQGSCGTDEPCFTSRTWISRSEILAQARSKADTRMWNDAIRRLLGISAITWKDLESAGIRRSEVQRKKSKDQPFVSNSRQRQRPSPPPHQDPSPEVPSEPNATDKQMADIKAYCGALNISTEAKGGMLVAAGWRKGQPVSQSTAQVMLGELAKVCKERKVDDPVTGEVHESLPAALQEPGPKLPNDDDIPF